MHLIRFLRALFFAQSYMNAPHFPCFLTPQVRYPGDERSPSGQNRAAGARRHLDFVPPPIPGDFIWAAVYLELVLAFFHIAFFDTFTDLSRKLWWPGVLRPRLVLRRQHFPPAARREEAKIASERREDIKRRSPRENHWLDPGNAPRLH